MQSSVLIQMSIQDLEELVQSSISAALRQHQPTITVDQDEWLTRDEAARMLHVSLPTLREFERRRELLPARIGRRVLYSRRTVEARLKPGGNNR